MIQKNFDEILDVDKVMNQIREDLQHYQKNDPASAGYTDDQILAVRHTAKSLSIHRILHALVINAESA